MTCVGEQFVGPGAAHVIASALGDQLVLDGPVGHHLARVRRLRLGEVVTAADGGGTWRSYVVDAVGPNSLTLTATTARIGEPRLTPRLAVAFCLTKGDKPEAVVAKLTEVGVDRIVPVLSRRSVVRWDAARAAASAERWAVVARGAAEQCRRARLPEITPVAPLVSLAGHPRLVYGTPDGRDRPDDVIAGGAEVLAVVGPEGGLEPDEVELLAPSYRLAVAPTILRADTAAAALGAVLATARWACDQRQ